MSTSHEARGLNRRHMDETQRAAAVVALSEFRNGGDRKSNTDQSAPVHSDRPTTRKKAAAKAHVAGPSVTIRGRTVQRCMWCGEKLIDSKNSAAPLNPDGTVPEHPTWKVGEVIQIEGHNPRRESACGDFERIDLPPDFCLSLVE